MTYQEQPQSRVPQATDGGADASRDWAGDPTGQPPDGHPSDLTCPHLPRVSLYHDGELDDEERRELAEHLATCRTCTEGLAFFGRVSGAFSATPPQRLEPQSRDRLRSLVSPPLRPAVGAGLGSGRGIPAHVRWVRRLTAVAAVLFVVALCRLAYKHYPFTAPDTTPVIHPEPTPVVPENRPKTTNHPIDPAPSGQPGTGSPRPDDRRPKAAPAPAGPSSMAPAVPTVG